MKYIKASKYVIKITVFLYFIGKIYFGWNKEPLSVNEARLDILISVLLALYIVLYLMPLAKIYENKVKETDKNK